MKRGLLWVTALFQVLPLMAQIGITSFNQNGELTWTNAYGISNATYRVEWAPSVAGPWQTFDALTPLTFLPATNTSVTVQVPTLYRVVWVDPPPVDLNGTWDYQGFDSHNVLVVTGQLALVYSPDQDNNIAGMWDLAQTTNTTSDPLGPQIGTGNLQGNLQGSAVFISLNPGVADAGVNLQGQAFLNTITGNWLHNTLAGPRIGGAFIATKEPGTALKAPPASSAQGRQAVNRVGVPW